MKNFIKDEEYVYINTPYAEAYIPEDLFGNPEKEATVASEYGNGIMTIGIFNMRFFDSDNQDRDSVKLDTFNYPNMIETYPSDFEVETLEINGIRDKYRVLKYVKGDIMMKSLIKQDSLNCELFLNLLTSGKIPTSLSYPDILKAWIKNFQINGLDPGVPYVTMQVIISEMCRDKKDPTTQFRKIAGKGKVSMYDYKCANMNEVSSNSSVLSALTFERFSDKLTSSINMTKEGTKQKKSPIEKVISM